MLLTFAAAARLAPAPSTNSAAETHLPCALAQSPVLHWHLPLTHSVLPLEDEQLKMPQVPPVSATQLGKLQPNCEGYFRARRASRSSSRACCPRLFTCVSAASTAVFEALLASPQTS